MPYIEGERRKWFNSQIDELVKTLDQIRNSEELSDGYITGDVNYIVYKMIVDLFRKNMKYKQGSSLHAALIDAAHEFKRRHLDPYEDEAVIKNGDI